MIGVMTVCGRITPATMGSRLDRNHLETMRMETDTSLMGAATLSQDDPEMRGPDGHLPESRIRAVITMSGRIPVEGKRLFQEGPPPVVFTSRDNASALSDHLGSKGHVVVLPEGPHGLAIGAAISELSRMGAKTVLIEGGARLNYAALSERVVDEICLTIAPKLSGEKGAASFADGAVHLGKPFLDLKLLDCRPRDTGEIFLRYEVNRT
jgi:diaminohydroxyphosphoribosylaminopyrimidine deaminase/5-amino-6-(5-phosphoribosylamino)uracil reductase